MGGVGGEAAEEIHRNAGCEKMEREEKAQGVTFLTVGAVGGL